MSVIVMDHLAAFEFPQGNANADAGDAKAAAPALAGMIGGGRKPKMVGIHQLIAIFPPPHPDEFLIGIGIEIIMIEILIQGLQFPLPIRGALLKAADIGIVIIDNIDDAESSLPNGMTIGIIIATQIKI